MLALAATGGCASLDGVAARKPDRADIANIVAVEATCRKEDAPRCTPDAKAPRAEIRDLRCESLELRAGVTEVARAHCVYSATVRRASGEVIDLGRQEGDFGLNNFATGAYTPVYAWSRAQI